jgi:hypothetical protein
VIGASPISLVDLRERVNACTVRHMTNPRTTADRLQIIRDYREVIAHYPRALSVDEMAAALDAYYDADAEMEAAAERAYLNAFRWTYEYNPVHQDEMRRDDERAAFFGL